METLLRTIRLIGKSVIFFLVSTAVSCSPHRGEAERFTAHYYIPEYAEGFEIIGYEDSLSRVIRIKTSWQGEDSTTMELFIRRGGESVPEGFRGQVLENRADRIAAMSSSYISMLDMIGKVENVKAVSGMDFISNGYVQAHRDSIEDVGYDNNIDYEKLVGTRPDIVLLYGINGSNVIETKLKSLGISYLYMGEYLEPDPLGKVEWLAVISELTGDRSWTDRNGNDEDNGYDEYCGKNEGSGKSEGWGKGEEVFKRIESRYMELKGLVEKAGKEAGDKAEEKSVEKERFRPEVMLNTPYGDTWFMSPGKSAMARMISDAGAHYSYDRNDTNRSVPIDLEEAFLLTSRADFWLNTGQICSMEELKSTYAKFAETKPVKEGNVYNCDKRLNGKGGNDFWESGSMNPDLVLEDLIRIFHPELLTDGADHKDLEDMMDKKNQEDKVNKKDQEESKFHYYRRLQ